MPPTKSVIVGVSVSAGVAVTALVIVLVLIFTRRPATDDDSDPTAATKCGAPPEVQPDGTVTNFTHCLMPDKTCGENVAALDELCRRSMCTVAPCEGYATWDAYDAQTHACYKSTHPTCEQQLCDSPVCTTPSVRAVLPPMHKLRNAAGECVNPGDSEVGALCDGLTGFQFVYPNCLPSTAVPLIAVTPLSSTTSMLMGVLTVPSVDPLIVTFSLQGPTGVLTGPVFLTPPAKTSLCVPGDTCATYNIHVQPALRPGNYKLTLHARPEWSAVNTFTSVEPVSLTLSAPPAEVNVYSQLNPVPTSHSAEAVKTQDQLVRTLLTEAAQRRQRLSLNVPATLTADSLLWLTPSDQEQGVLTAACTPDLCGLEGGSTKLMPYSIVFVAWPPVAPLSGSGCAGPVQYDVTCQEEAGGSVTLPVLQQSMRPSFADVVRVGETVTYRVIARQGECRSQPVTVVVYVPPFSDKEVCSKVKLPPPLDMASPPWMWSSLAGCQWLPDYLPAQDLYCMLHAAPSAPVDVQTLVLSADNTCHRVKPSYARVTHDFPGPYCDDTTTLKQACFNGLDTGVPRRAECSFELNMGDSGSTISNVAALVNRIDQVQSFLRIHPGIYPDAQVPTLAQAREQAPGVYYKCGPESAPTTWGMDSTKCAALDVQCTQAAKTAACDHNYCDAWTPTPGKPLEFEQTRLCFVSPAVGLQKCCEPDEVYTFDASQQRGGARGTCKKKVT